MPVRALKLDRSLVATMRTDPRSAAIVRSMARLGAETGVDVVAEGIEDAETALACREAGVTYGQGWFFARDVPMDVLETTLTDLGAPAPPRDAGRRGPLATPVDTPTPTG